MLPKSLQALPDPVKEVKISDFLRERLERGQIKLCEDCRRRIGFSFIRCGLCEDKHKAVEIARQNGIVFGRKGRELTQRAKDNIGAANRKKAGAGDKSICKR